MKVERACGQRSAIGDSPGWRARENALYWVDIGARKLLRLAEGDSRVTVWDLPERAACIAFARNGALIAGMESGLFAVTLAEDGTAATRRLATPSFTTPGMRFNDGRCDRQGRFWAGTLHPAGNAMDPVGKLYRYDAVRGMSGPAVDGLVVQNGLAWSPDGCTMYLSDSHASRRLVWAFDFDVATGTPHDRRVFVDMNLHPGRPDGAAMDADGCYWTCAVDAGLLLRFTPEGRLDRQIAVPVPKPSMCAFGGPDLDRLYVTSIRPANAGPDADDGCIFVVEPGIAGVPEPAFAGDL
jgi:sugar lactone lactonase YvrE